MSLNMPICPACKSEYVSTVIPPGEVYCYVCNGLTERDLDLHLDRLKTPGFDSFKHVLTRAGLDTDRSLKGVYALQVGALIEILFKRFFRAYLITKRDLRRHEAKLILKKLRITDLRDSVYEGFFEEKLRATLSENGYPGFFENWTHLIEFRNRFTHELAFDVFEFWTPINVQAENAHYQKLNELARSPGNENQIENLQKGWVDSYYQRHRDEIAEIFRMGDLSFGVYIVLWNKWVKRG